MAEKSKNDKKLMDVSRPGKSAPSASSRPIIVTHGPIMQDPMVQKEVSSEEVKLTTVAREKVIDQPKEALEEAKDKPEVEDNKKAVVPAEPEESTPKETAQPEEAKADGVEKSPEEPKPENDSTPLDGDASATVEAVAEATNDKKKADEDQKAAEAQQAKVKQLVSERKYFVPLSVARHKRHHRTWLIVTMILLLAVAVAAVYAYKTGLLDSLL